MQGVLRVRVDRMRPGLPIRTPADLMGLLESLEEPPREWIQLLATTGLRQGEAKALEWGDWDRDSGVLAVHRGRETTKRHQRSILLPKLATEALWAIAELSGDGCGPYILSIHANYRPLTSQLNSVLRPHGVRPHDLRRFFVTALETLGAPKTVVDDLVGHSADKVRAAYTPAENVEAARPWIEKFDQWLEGIG